MYIQGSRRRVTEYPPEDDTAVLPTSTGEQRPREGVQTTTQHRRHRWQMRGGDHHLCCQSGGPQLLMGEIPDR